jgi:hypothetical protein
MPDSFAFKDAASFHLCETNYDRVITLGDIWSKILNPTLLERLTDDKGNDSLREIEYAPNSVVREQNPQFM